MFYFIDSSTLRNTSPIGYDNSIWYILYKCLEDHITYEDGILFKIKDNILKLDKDNIVSFRLFVQSLNIDLTKYEVKAKLLLLNIVNNYCFMWDEDELNYTYYNLLDNCGINSLYYLVSNAYMDNSILYEKIGKEKSKYIGSIDTSLSDSDIDLSYFILEKYENQKLLS